MATTDYDFSQTRTEIISRAFRLIGALALGETLSAEQSEQGIIALNTAVKDLQNDHIFLWTLKTDSFSTVAGTASYALDTDPAVINYDRVFMRISNNDTPIRIISFREYQEIENKTAAGDPIVVAIDNLPAPTGYFWPTPNSIRTIFTVGVTKLKDWDTAAGTGDFPAKFLTGLTYRLAADLADEYGLPIGERGRLDAKANALLLKARAADRERADESFVAGAFD